MKTKRLGLVSAATLALAVLSMPALAQDAPRKKERPSQVPRARAPQKPKAAPKTAPAAEPEDAPAAEGDDAPAAEGDASPETSSDADEAGAGEAGAEVSKTDAKAGDAGDDASDDAELDEALDPEDAIAPADDEEAAATKPRSKTGPAHERGRRGERPPLRRGRRGAPPSATSKAKPGELEYVDGMDIPSDYTLVERTRTGLVVAGAVTFGVGWLAAATFAASQSGRDGGCDSMGSRRSDESFSAWSCEHGGDHADFAPLYIPLAGPFIALGTLEEADGAMRAGLLLDGVVQVGGAAMFVAGIVAKKSTLIRTKFATMSVVPGPGSLQVFGSF